MSGLTLDQASIIKISDLVTANLRPIIEKRKIDDLPRFLKRKSVAAYMGVSPHTVSKWGSRGKIGYDGQVHYLKPDLESNYDKNDLIHFDLMTTKKY